MSRPSFIICPVLAVLFWAVLTGVFFKKVYQALISERINTISSDVKERVGYRLIEDPMF
jgi:hypothetical protein